jgi:hypothetical protein
MATFSFRKPRIISKKFPGMDSTIDGVTKSLNELVFSYADKVDKTLQKKHIMMAMSSLALLLVLGSFISPKGKAESSIFYPETCLGGWVNPQYAQGEQETTSNGDESQFTKHNSAVLPKNTNAEMYCGNFKGEFDSATRPTKIIVSLALTKGSDLLIEDQIESGLVATSSLEVVETLSASSTDVSLSSSTIDTILVQASSTDSSQEATTTSSAQTIDELQQATPTPIVSPEEPPSVIHGIIESVQDTINTLFNTSQESTPGTTDTVVVPPPQLIPEPIPEPVPAPIPAPTPEPTPEPISYIQSIRQIIVASLFQRVFAQESTSDAVPVVAPVEEVTPPPASVSEQVVTEPVPLTVETPQSSDDLASTSPVTPSIDLSVATTTESEIVATSTASTATTPLVETSTSSNQDVSDMSLLQALTNSFIQPSSTEATSTTSEVSTTTMTETNPNASSTDSNQFQNNFLEVFYTFDGVTWVSLGELNDISMKYRTFEIPVNATTSWNDMNKLQVKVVSKKNVEDTPTVYLDAIKVEVLYESPLLHTHPDFARDTILSDETVSGMRILGIVNSETNKEEIWYMYLDIASSTDEISVELHTASTTDVATSTILIAATSTLVIEGVTSTKQTTNITGDATTSASSSELRSKMIKPVLPKNIWMKFEGKRKEGMSLTAFARHIRKLDEDRILKKYREMPDFSLDIIKRIKGTFLNAIIVQLQKNGNEELWVYDLEDGTEEKIETGSSTLISDDFPLGVKDGHLFWVSKDKSSVFAYNMTTKEIQEKTLHPFDVAQGERGEVVFEGIPWTIFVNAENFSFFSKSTGEVFSDDDGSFAEILRQKLQLDTVLDKEELSNLNLQVEEIDSTK